MDDIIRLLATYRDLGVEPPPEVAAAEAARAALDAVASTAPAADAILEAVAGGAAPSEQEVAAACAEATAAEGARRLRRDLAAGLASVQREAIARDLPRVIAAVAPRFDGAAGRLVAALENGVTAADLDAVPPAGARAWSSEKVARWGEAAEAVRELDQMRRHLERLAPVLAASGALFVRVAKPNASTLTSVKGLVSGDRLASPWARILVEGHAIALDRGAAATLAEWRRLAEDARDRRRAEAAANVEDVPAPVAGGTRSRTRTRATA